MLSSEEITQHPDLVAFWDFQEPTGSVRVSKGPRPYGLRPHGGEIRRVEGGVFGSYAAYLAEGQWFSIPRTELGDLNIHGPQAQVSVLAWIMRGRKSTSECEAVAGIWDETRAKRQYCLFLNLKIWDSRDQVCGHVSAIGGPTPGYRYCMDAAIGKTPVPFDVWQCVAFTYDGEYAKAYLNGVLDERPGRNPYRYEGGLFDGGPDGGDFTVGGVSRSGEMGNWFTGTLGGLAVFRKALSPEEMARLGGKLP